MSVNARRERKAVASVKRCSTNFGRRCRVRLDIERLNRLALRFTREQSAVGGISASSRTWKDLGVVLSADDCAL